MTSTVADTAPVLRVVGELNVAGAGAVRAALAALGGETAYVVDLRGASPVEPAALDGLMADLGRLERQGVTVTLLVPGRLTEGGAPPRS